MKIHKHLLTILLSMGLLWVLPTGLAAQAVEPAGPTEIAAERRRADQLYEEGKTEEAKVVYLRLAPSFPDDFELQKRLAYCFFTSPRKEMTQAARYYARAYELNPQDRGVELNLGKAHSWSRQYRAAIVIFQRILAREPSNGEVLLELARAQNYSGQTQPARATYESYLQRFPRDRDVRLEFAAFLGWNNQNDAALEQYRSVLQVDPRNVKARVGEAQVLSWQGKLQESLVAFDDVLRRVPNHYDALRGKAFAVLWLQRYEEASQIFAQVTRQRPPDRDIEEALRQIAAWRAAEPERRAQAELQSLQQQADAAIAQSDFPRAIELLQQIVARAPQDQQKSLRFLLGQVYLWNRQWAEAIEAFQKLYAEDPNNLAALRELGHAQIGANRPAEAASSFRAYLERSPEPAVRLSLAQVLSWSGQLEEATALFQQILQSEPDNFDASLGLAQTLAWRGQNERALEIFESLLRQRPGHREALLGRARSLYWSGNLDQALAALESMRQTWPQDQEIGSLLESVRDTEMQRAIQQGPSQPPEDIERRIQNVQQILARNPNDVRYLRMLGDLYQLKKDFSQAISYYEQALEQQPGDTSLRFMIAQVANWSRDFPRAIRFYQDLLAQNPENREYRFELAKILSWVGRNSESTEQYREIVKRNPTDREALLGLARVLSWNRQLDESIQEYTTLLQADPRNREAMVERARVYSWKGEAETALDLFDDVLIQLPEDRDARFGKAQALQMSGQPREAVAILHSLREEHPQDRDVALALADAQLALGRRDLALRQLDEVEQAEPGSREVETRRMAIRQELRPELIVQFSPSFQIDDLKIYPYKATLYFNLTPMIRSYVSGSIIQSTFFAPDGVAQGREAVWGSSWQVNSRLSLRGNIGVNSSSARELLVSTSPFGFVQLAQGERQTREDLIGGAGVSVAASNQMRFHFDYNRRFLNYIPRSIQRDIHFDEFRPSWDYRPFRRLGLHLDYYHLRYSDENRQHGGTGWAAVRVVQSEAFNVEVGYHYSVYTFSQDPLSKPVSSGFFAPRRFRRHAGTGTVYGKLSDWFGYNLSGSLGKERFPQQLPLMASAPPFFVETNEFRGDGSIRATVDFTLNRHAQFSLGYSYARLAGLTQPGAVSTDIFSTHGAFIILNIRF